MTSPWIGVYHFTFKGIEGRIEVNNGFVFVCYGNMGASIDSVVGPLHEFVIEVLNRECDYKVWK